MGIGHSLVEELSTAHNIKARPANDGERGTALVILHTKAAAENPLRATMQDPRLSGSSSLGPLAIAYLHLKDFDPRKINLKNISPREFHRLWQPLVGLTQQEIAAYFGVKPQKLLAARRRLSIDGFDFNTPLTYIPPEFRKVPFQDSSRLTPRELQEALRWEMTQRAGKQAVKALTDKITLTGVAFLQARALAFENSPVGSTKKWAPLARPPLTVDTLVSALSA